VDKLSKEYATRLVRERWAGKDPADLDWSAEMVFVDGFFGAIRQGEGTATGWQHGSPLLQPENLYALDVDRMTLRQWASEYIENLPLIHRRELDWLIVDVLMLSEISAFAAHLNPIKSIQDKVTRRRLGAAAALWTVFKWGIAAFTLAGALVADLPGLAMLIFGFIVLRQSQLWWRNRKAAGLLLSMTGAYAAIGSWSTSWTNLWELLRKSRDLGAVWDPEVYRIVELRMRGSESATQGQRTLAHVA
jgi:hypothetical protein